MNRSTSSFGRTVSHVGLLAKRAAVVGFSALGAGIGFAVHEAAEAVRVTAKTRAVIKSTGGAANVTAKHVDNLANKILNYSGESDEAVASAQNVLLTFKDVRNEVGEGNKIFDEATKRIVDMSVALGKDLQSSTIMVGKALNDPIGGITAMTRAGVQFTEAQKEQIATLVESGRKLDAQKIILGELESQFGGTARAVGNKEPWRVLWGQIGNVAEELGTQLLPYARDFSKWAIEKLPGAVKGVKEFATGAVDWLGQTKDGFLDWAEELDKSLGGTGAGEGITATWQGIQNDASVTASAVGGTFSDLFTKTIDEMRESGQEFTGWSAVAAGAIDIGQEATEKIADTWGNFREDIAGTVSDLQDFADTLKDVWTGNSNFGDIAGAWVQDQLPHGTAPSTANEPRAGSEPPKPTKPGSGQGGTPLIREAAVINLNFDGRRQKRWELRDNVLLGNA